MRKAGLRTIAASLLLAGAAQAQDIKLDNCVDLSDQTEADYPVAFTCVGLLQGEIARLSGALEGVNDRLGQIEEATRGLDPIPSGTVAAFDLSDGCPDSWAPFAESQGRVIIGASFGISSGLFRVEPKLTDRKYREHGGEEKVRLSLGQMPEHSHFIPSDGSGHDDIQSLYNTPNSDEGISTNSARTSSAGKSEPHNNMPPFLALYFCKKS